MDGGLTILKAGVVPHEVMDEKMKKMQLARISGEIEDTLIFVEHNDIVTIGPRAAKSGISVPRGYVTRKVDRGGSITWHGPGQLVVYPILLWNKDDEKSVKSIISKLEQWVITAFKKMGIEGYRDDQMMGVWVQEKKVCSVGLSFMKWVSRHGLSINLNTPSGRVENLSGCGLSPNLTTSLTAIGHSHVTRELMEESLFESLEECLNRNIDQISNWDL